MKKIIGLLAGIAILAGCKTTPYSWERSIYDIQTNYIPTVHILTNTVTITNFQPVVVEKVVQGTNTVTVTNIVPIIKTETNLLTVTNFVEAYVYKPGTNAAKITEAAQQVGSYIPFPGAGDIASLIAGAAVGLWGVFRSRKAMTTAQTLSQAIEVSRNIIKSNPATSQYDLVFTKWMQDHQKETGVLQMVLNILKSSTDSKDAKEVAEELIKLTKTA